MLDKVLKAVEDVALTYMADVEAGTVKEDE